MKSRYADNQIIDNHHYATYSLPTFARGYRSFDLLAGVATEDYVWKRGDRFDKLAGLKLNDDTDWWVICLCNNITYPYGIVPGTIIKIPLDASEVKNKILR